MAKTYRGLLPAHFGGVAGLDGTLQAWAAQGWTLHHIGYDAEGVPHYVVFERDDA